MRTRFRPMRSFHSEAVALVTAIAVPIALFVVFPSAALRPALPVRHAPPGTSCAFVTLTPEQERKALSMARTTWQRDCETARRARIDILADFLPALPPRPTFDISSRMKIDLAAPGSYVPDLLPPTLAAPSPVKIAPQPDADKAAPTFSREELLKLN